MTPTDALIEKMARAVVAEFGGDPDELVPMTGYPSAPIIPRWLKECEWARRYLAFRAVCDEAEHEETKG